MIKITKYIDLKHFEPWCGAIAFYARLSEDEIELLEDYISEIADYMEIDETWINDFMWFDDEHALEVIAADQDEFWNRKIEAI